ncbi:hypothetical protein [Roseobacter sp. S98]|uniref:hypothetical protein n=1 Tax=Roseobacter algicola (ex Choi et al. 2025) (nom. illeg.) TaxID=3092138 RepID=UPI0035C74E55
MELTKENRLARVSFTGGIIGAVAGSEFGRLEKVVSVHNAEGWNVAEIVPESRNLIVWILRLLLLIVTLGLWTISTGYIVIFERPSDGIRRDKGIPTAAGAMRREPKLSSGGKTL